MRGCSAVIPVACSRGPGAGHLRLTCGARGIPMRLPARRGSAALVGLEGSAVPPALRLGGAATAALTPMILIWALELYLILHHFLRVLCVAFGRQPSFPETRNLQAKPTPFGPGPAVSFGGHWAAIVLFEQTPLFFLVGCWLMGYRDKSTSSRGDHLCVGCGLQQRGGQRLTKGSFLDAVTHLVSLSHPQGGPTPPRVVVSERRPTNEVSTLKLSRFWVALQIAICAHQPQPSVPGLELYFPSRCFLSISDPTGWERNRSGHGRQKDHPSPNPSRNNLDFTVATKSERPRHNGFGSAHRHPRELGLARYPGRVPRRPQSEAGPNIPSVCLCVSWLGNGIAG